MLRQVFGDFASLMTREIGQVRKAFERRQTMFLPRSCIKRSLHIWTNESNESNVSFVRANRLIYILKVIENKLMQVWVRFRMIKCLGYVKAPRAVDSTSFRSTCADLISGAKVFQGISKGISMLRFTNGNTQTSRNTWGTRIMSDNNTP